MHRIRNVSSLLVTAILIAACAPAVAPTQSGDSVATAVAGTMQALTAVAPAPTTAPLTSAPTEAPQPTASQGIPVNYKNVSFVIPAGLASDALPQTIAAMTEQTSGPWDVAPEHIRFSLRNYYVAVKPFSVCQIDIYPADEYANQHTAANVSLQRLKGALGNPSASLTNETLPQVPYFNAASVFAAQVKRIHFVGIGSLMGSPPGVLFLSRGSTSHLWTQRELACSSGLEGSPECARRRSNGRAQEDLPGTKRVVADGSGSIAVCLGGTHW